MHPAKPYTSTLPPALQSHAIHSRREDVQADGKGSLGRLSAKGGSDLTARIADLDMEGIDAEIIFPTVALFAFLIEHREAEVASARAYNDWLNGYLKGQYHRFVRCGILPIRHFDDTVAEMERLAAAGFTACMLPSSMPPGCPDYNDEGWDKVFDAAQRLNMVMTLHTVTGRADIRPEKGAGGAVINYTDQMRDAIHSIMYMVSGGVLDRFPQAQVVVVESGASWLAGLAERMDEVYEAHYSYVRPKLADKPSAIIQRQVSATFQYDRACIMSRSVTGTKPLIWGSDYPHTEGTFPHSREVVASLFDDIDISESEKADIVGLNGARLFRLSHPALDLTPA